MAASRVRVLLVGQDAPSTERIRGALSPRFTCEVAESGESGLAAFGAERFDMVVSSDALAGMSGLDLLDSVLERSPETPFILVGDDAAVSSVVAAAKRGAYDYIAKPFDEHVLAGSLERAAAQLEPGSGAARLRGPRTVAAAAVIGTSARFRETLDAVDRVAHSSSPVLLVGETGTGKHLLAARIHAHGPRRHRPYVVVDAAGRQSSLESDLFGHVAGTFGGATRARKGLIAEADGGTIFLDEIGDLSIELQGRLLRTLECGAIRAVGADYERQVDVRFLAATHRDLAAAVRQRTFREDLYFRLSSLAIQVPSLRQRGDDVPALITYFFERARAKHPHASVETIGSGAQDGLVVREWPGNVRELQGVVERLVVMGKGKSVEAVDVSALGDGAASADGGAPTGMRATLRDVTTRHVESVLLSTNGDKARAAAILGVDVSTLYRWQRRRPEP